MSAPQKVAYTLGHERQTPTGGVGTPPPPRGTTGPGRVLRRGGRRVPRCRPPFGPSLGRRTSSRGRAGPRDPLLSGAASQVDTDPREDRQAVARRRPEGARVRDRVVDCTAAEPTHPGGVQRPAESEVPQLLAPGSRVHPPEARTCPMRARPGGDRRLAGVRLAAHPKKARRQRAKIALIDESGLLMGPLLRRTWAPKGKTPAITQRGAHRQKVSVAAAVWLSPLRDRLGLYSHTLADGYFDNWYVTAFVEAKLKEVGGRFVVVWDGGNMHKGEPIDALESHFAGRLSL